MYEHNCGNCRYGSYDKMQGYVCVNADSEYVADFVEYNHTCDEWKKKEKAVTIGGVTADCKSVPTG